MNHNVLLFLLPILCIFRSSISGNNYFITNWFVRRTSEIFQPAIVRSGHRVHGWRVVDRDGKHEHVHLRNSSGIHPNGKRGFEQDAGNYRLEGWRFDFRSR